MDNSREVDVVCSTQWQSQLQKDIAVVLGVAQNKVHVRTKRLGGGFGGKETGGNVGAACCAVAAVKFNRPVRIALERDEDMLHTGTRHPSQFHYKIGFNKDGKVISYKSKSQKFTGHGWSRNSEAGSRRMVWIRAVVQGGPIRFGPPTGDNWSKLFLTIFNG